MAGSSLVLEGGGMRGVFTAGVLDCFLDHHITFDHCVGVSAGACHACSYLSGQRGRGYHTIFNYVDDPDYVGAQIFLKTGDVFGVKRAYDDIPNVLLPYDYQAFDANPTVFDVVVTNCLTGRPEYKTLHDMHKDIAAVRASSSLPLLSRLVMLDGVPCLDGGISDSIPIEYSIQKGYAKRVVVLTQPAGYRKGPNRLAAAARVRYPALPAIATAMAHRHLGYNHSLEVLEQLEKQGEAFVIRPPRQPEVGRIERDRVKLAHCYKMGYDTAEALLSDLQAYLRA